MSLTECSEGRSATPANLLRYGFLSREGSHSVSHQTEKRLEIRVKVESLPAPLLAYLQTQEQISRQTREPQYQPLVDEHLILNSSSPTSWVSGLLGA